MLLSPITVTRRRYAAQTIGSDGRPTTSASDSSIAMTTVRPTSGRDREMLPDGAGDRFSELITLTSPPGSWRTADQAAGTIADEVVIGSTAYTVIAVRASTGLIPHDRVVAGRNPEAIS